jgi:hypothetical protein
MQLFLTTCPASTGTLPNTTGNAKPDQSHQDRTSPDQQRRVVFVDKQRGHSQSLSEDASNIHSSDTTPNVFATDTARLIAVYADSPHTLEQAAQDLLARAPATSAKLSRQDKRRLRTVDGAVAALQASRGAATAWHTQAAVYALKYQMSRAPGVVKCTMTESDA